MNKGDLIDRIAEREDITKKKAGNIIDTLMNTVINAVSRGDDVRLVGFGTFYSTRRKARMGVNPQTGDRMRIPAKTVPKFRAGSAFKESVE